MFAIISVSNEDFGPSDSNGKRFPALIENSVPCPCSRNHNLRPDGFESSVLFMSLWILVF